PLARHRRRRLGGDATGGLRPRLRRRAHVACGRRRAPARGPVAQPASLPHGLRNADPLPHVHPGRVTRSRRPAGRVFHGWWIVATAFVALAVNVGLLFYSWGVFLSPLSEAFGGRARVAGAYSAMQVACALYGLAV